MRLDAELLAYWKSDGLDRTLRSMITNTEWEQLCDLAIKGLASPGEALEKDAARYRWLRNQDEGFWIRHRVEDGLECDLFGHDLDAAIDAAILAYRDKLKEGMRPVENSNARKGQG